MNNKSVSIKLIVASLFSIMFGAFNGLWSIIAVIIEAYKKIYEIANEEHSMSSLINHCLRLGMNTVDAIRSGFNANDLDSWLKLLELSTTMGRAHKNLVIVTASLQVICGVLGIIFACIILSKRNTQWNSIPMLLGAMSLITGLLSVITLFIANLISFGATHVILIFTLLAMTFIYTRSAYKFNKKTKIITM